MGRIPSILKNRVKSRLVKLSRRGTEGNAYIDRFPVTEQISPSRTIGKNTELPHDLSSFSPGTRTGCQALLIKLKHDADHISSGHLVASCMQSVTMTMQNIANMPIKKPIQKFMPIPLCWGSPADGADAVTKPKPPAPPAPLPPMVLTDEIRRKLAAMLMGE